MKKILCKTRKIHQLTTPIIYSKIIKPYLLKFNYTKKDIFDFLLFLKIEHSENIKLSNLVNLYNIVFEKNNISINLINKFRNDLIYLSIDYWIRCNRLDGYDEVYIMVRKKLVKSLSCFSIIKFINLNEKSNNFIVSLLIMHFFKYKFLAYSDASKFADTIIFCKNIKNKLHDYNIKMFTNSVYIENDINSMKLINESNYSAQQFLIEYNYYNEIDYRSNNDNEFICIFYKRKDINNNIIINHSFNEYL